MARIDIISEEHAFVWKVNTVQLLKEVVNHNPSAWALAKPIQIFGILLAELGEIASNINDPKLNAMMCRLAIYECSDPYNVNHDEALTRKTISKGYPKKFNQH